MFSPAENPTPQSVVFHAPIVANISIGQKTDMDSYHQKYLNWLQSPNRTAGFISYAISRGTAGAFCNLARHKYKELRLAIFEGAIDSVADIIPRRAAQKFKSEYLAKKFEDTVNTGLTFFTQYKPTGPSPIACVSEFPEGVPAVFITSKLDMEVPSENTERLAVALANRGKNDVYLLRLHNSSHPNYMFDDKNDRDMYEAFIHAIYKKYDLYYDYDLANKGAAFLKDATVFEVAPQRIFHLN